jgi:phage baseplate assembly protein gpV
MSDRTINFGTDDTEATYQIQDDDPLGGGNFAINDLDAATAILEYDQINDTWVVTEIDVATINGADTSTASANEVLESDGAGNLTFETGSVTINGNTINLGGSVTLNAADVGAVDTSDFPTLEDQNGNPLDSTDTLTFDTS